MNYRNARYIDATRIDCEIEHPVYGWIPYTLDPSDTDMTVNNAELLSAMRQRGDVAAYIPPTPEELTAITAGAVRAERDMKLAIEVDSIAGNTLRWAELSAEKQQAWAAYRQALRDVPAQEGFPTNVVWPVAP